MTSDDRELLANVAAINGGIGVIVAEMLGRMGQSGELRPADLRDLAQRLSRMVEELTERANQLDAVEAGP